MALDVSTFRVRAVSSIFFVIIMMIGLLYNWWSFATLFTIVMIGALLEFFRMMKAIHGKNYKPYLLFSVIYIILPIIYLVDLGTEGGLLSINAFDIKFDPTIPCLIIFSIWINDTMAYIVGSMIGKTPFSKISPKKTWEGTIGGAILCVTVITLLSRIIPSVQDIEIKYFIIISSICAVFGTLGDLLESKLKRIAGIKDSGTIMPGHGGFLDRFDSLLVAVPFVWIYLRCFA